MDARNRWIAYGSAGLLVAAGTLCAIFIPGTAGQIATFVLIAFGLGGAVLLVFYEVGLSEDRERATERRRDRARREARRPIVSPSRDPRLRSARFRRRP